MAIPYNVGSIDRVIRLLTGVILIYIAFFESDIIPDEFFSYLVGGFGIVNIITAIFSWCPLYHLINLDTTTNSQPEV